MKTIVFVLFVAVACVAHAQTAPGPKPPLAAPKDAKFFNWKWYAVFYDKVSWHVARDKCARMGGQLAVVPDKTTWNFVKGMTKTRVWLGATDEKVEGEWVWVDGTKMTFTAWSPGNPDNAGGKEHYLNGYAEKDIWNDTGKEWNFYKEAPIVGFICEWPAR
jgi:hypothetical protein